VTEDNVMKAVVLAVSASLVAASAGLVASARGVGGSPTASETVVCAGTPYSPDAPAPADQPLTVCIDLPPS
jgi:hypothetical protein